jgi:hypothetical protein
MQDAMQPAPDGLGLVAPAPDRDAPGAGGRNAQPLPRAARARLAHETPQSLLVRGDRDDPHAPRHPPPAMLTPLAPAVAASGGMQRELLKGADAEASRRLAQNADRPAEQAKQKGGRAGKHVEGAAVGPASGNASDQRHFTA